MERVDVIVNKKIWSKETIEKLEKIHINIWIIASAIIMLFVPLFFFVLIFLIVLKVQLKEQKILREELDKDTSMFNQGYKKICKNIYIKEAEHKIKIYDVDYGFSQIIDCELIENDNIVDNTYGETNGKTRNRGRVKSRTNTVSSSENYCSELYLNITVDDFKNPNIKVNLKNNSILNKNGKQYRKLIDETNEILSTFKLIISKNNEKYIEKGTITKIEHKYITEEDASTQIKKLSELHDSGVLTDYEFSVKKQELLAKIK